MQGSNDFLCFIHLILVVTSHGGHSFSTHVLSTSSVLGPCQVLGDIVLNKGSKVPDLREPTARKWANDK